MAKKKAEKKPEVKIKTWRDGSGRAYLLKVSRGKSVTLYRFPKTQPQKI
jgi:hypothetical protein